MISSVPPPTPDALALADRLRPLILKLGRRLRREAQKLGISALDAQLLGIIAQRPGIGVSELAAIEQVSGPSMSVHVKRLVAEGWLIRDSAADGDQRRVRLTLTARASESIAAIRQQRNDWLAARIARLGADDRAVLAAAAAPLDQLLTVEP